MKVMHRNELEARRIYVLRSRNLLYGMWRPAHNDFVGIREKFGSRFLDSEIFNHTAFPLRATEHTVPDDVPMEIYLGSVDEATGRPVKFDKPVAQGGRGWYFLDGEQEASEEIRASAVSNGKLFEILDATKREEEDDEDI